MKLWNALSLVLLLVSWAVLSVYIDARYEYNQDRDDKAATTSMWELEWIIIAAYSA